MAGIARFVGRFFAPADFAAYAKEASKHGSWNPVGITVHHTGAPSLAQRPYGFTAQHMQNIKWGYENDRAWSSGPHFFVDQNGIWVFVDPAYPGIHAVSFNDTHHGLEMLGNYDSESVNTDVLANTAICIRACMNAWGYDKYNFHRDCKHTKKTCPGIKITRAIIDNALTGVPSPVKAKVVAEDGQQAFTETMIVQGRLYVPARSFAAWLGIPKSYLYYSEDGLHIDGDPVDGDILVGQVCWVPVVEMAHHAKAKVTWDEATKTAFIARPLG